MNKKTIKIDNKFIGDFFPCYIIAEIGSNHGGDIDRAKLLISECAKAGADAVKFQSWTANGLQNSKDITQDGTLANSKSIPTLEKFQLPDRWHFELSDFCRNHGIHFLSTPFDIGRARLLKQVGCPAIKISSSDTTYVQLLEEVGTYDIPILMSVGMSSIEEVKYSLSCLGTAKNNTVLLHCVAAYPPAIEDANLRVLQTLANVFECPLGFSDHFPGHDLVLAAVAMGARVIEKHVTFSRQDTTPDSFFSLTIEEFSQLIQNVRRLETALGNGFKQCMPSEKDGLTGGRRSAFAARDLRTGIEITIEDIAIVRPNIGKIKPSDVQSLIGRRLKIDIPQGTPLAWEHFDN